MVNLAVFLCYSQGLTADPTSSLLFLPEIFDPTATSQRLGQLPTQACVQVQFPLRIVGIGVTTDLHVSNVLHFRCRHKLDRQALALLFSPRTGGVQVAILYGGGCVSLLYSCVPCRIPW